MEGSTRRQRIADAAIETLAAVGMRGLTHRAVDRAAGLPEGSCSFYYRTRQALLQATLDRLLELEIADIIALPEPKGDDPVQRGTELAMLAIEHWTTKGRVRTLARHELSLEATRRPELRASLERASEHAHRPIIDLFEAAGISGLAKRVTLVVACIDGLILEYLTGPDGLDLDRAELRAVLLPLMSGLST
ncbi:TetR/AcrR family transcriptional regulator [[Actinomadura] parvosata]|uniref:TetR/AcrR family transcriptional regulator n=1 Tax=[Actinomadura] parvosata TaxID=1955412 RepID=UPI00406D257A